MRVGAVPETEADQAREGEPNRDGALTRRVDEVSLPPDHPRRERYDEYCDYVAVRRD